ncbi:MAG: DPP IV N-terminal domain-containing protein, partial [Chitinophagaceae bacterium]|nr:DPP IV N-terminal domain-containing protein [Chitinophagaceae bacterium]
MRKILLCACLHLFVLFVSAQSQKKNFSYDQLFKGAPMNVSKPMPAITGWVDDEHYIESRREDGKAATYSVDVKTGTAKAYTATTPAPEGGRQPAPSLGIKDARNTTISPDGKWAAYTKPDNNLYIAEVSTKKETQITKDGSETILNGYASWVYFEEILGRGSRYKAFWWSPDSKHICYMRFDDAQVPVFPIYWADGQHGRLENERYPKAGDKNPEVKIGIVTTDNPASTVWADFNPKQDQYFGAPIWAPSGQLWIQWMNRGQDTLTIYNTDLANGAKSVVYNETQKTWIDLDEGSRIQFLQDGKTFILKSDKDGWENLYLHDATGKQLNQITVGNFWGTSVVRVDEKNKTIYFRARKENSGRFDFYKTGLNGKGLTRLTFGEY